tara:strand:- start:194 stop:439 length:246 start_codon:yes stop_codon:yes gene_type:complete
MNKYRTLIIVLNFICVGFFIYQFFELGFPDKGRELFVYVLLLTPILTLHHLMFNRNKDDEESLFSLWVKLKKKNIKDELEK